MQGWVVQHLSTKAEKIYSNLHVTKLKNLRLITAVFVTLSEIRKALRFKNNLDKYSERLVSWFHTSVVNLTTFTKIRNAALRSLTSNNRHDAIMKFSLIFMADNRPYRNCSSSFAPLPSCLASAYELHRVKCCHIRIFWICWVLISQWKLLTIKVQMSQLPSMIF